MSLEKIEARDARRRAEDPAFAANELAMQAFSLAAAGRADPNLCELIFRMAAIVSQLAIENDTPERRRRRLRVVASSGDC